MIRLTAFLVLTAAFAVVAVWFADRPGDVIITWLGYRIETSVGVLAAIVAALACAAILLWTILRMLVGAPAAIMRWRARRRAARGRAAIANGLIAVGAGDVRAARRFAVEAGRYARAESLTLLLRAQTAQLGGQREDAEAAFRAMAEREDTKLFGLHGLFVEAARRHDPAARFFAEEAARTSPSLGWAGQAVLEFRCVDGDWAGALEALERNRQGGLLDADTFRRRRAVLLTAQALSICDSDRAAGRDLALEAVKLCPGFVPAAALAGRLLAEAEDQRRATRILETAWRESPHPDLAEAYANLVPGASARERLVRMRLLARLAPEHPESVLALARAAVDANEFAAARAALTPLLAAPTRRVATLMARLEESEHGDIGRAREWLARAVNAAHDPAWTADGLVAETWRPVSPATGRVDAFEWRVPVADLTTRGPLIDQAPTPKPAAATAISVSDPFPALASVAAAQGAKLCGEAASKTRPDEVAADVAASPLVPAAGTMGQSIALTARSHAPDDPGTEPERVREPVPRRKPSPSRRYWLFGRQL